MPDISPLVVNIVSNYYALLDAELELALVANRNAGDARPYPEVAKNSGQIVYVQGDKHKTLIINGKKMLEFPTEEVWMQDALAEERFIPLYDKELLNA